MISQITDQSDHSGQHASWSTQIKCIIRFYPPVIKQFTVGKHAVCSVQWATCSLQCLVQPQVIRSWSQWATRNLQCSVLTDLCASSGTTLIELWWYLLPFCFGLGAVSANDGRLLSRNGKRSFLSSQMPSNSSNLPNRSFAWAKPFDFASWSTTTRSTKASEQPRFLPSLSTLVLICPSTFQFTIRLSRSPINSVGVLECNAVCFAAEEFFLASTLLDRTQVSLDATFVLLSSTNGQLNGQKLPHSKCPKVV